MTNSETGHEQTPQDVASGRDQKRRGLKKLSPFILLLFAAVLPYLNSLRNDFVFDDSTQVVQNPLIRSFDFTRIFGSSVWSYLPGFRGTSNYYRPIMTLGYAVCYRCFGLRPFGFHFANLLLNACVVLLLFGLTKKIFRNGAVALSAALVFAVHPIHSEAVDWIGAVTELELAFFFILTFKFYLSTGEESGFRHVVTEAGLWTCFILALLSKEQALTLPLLATLYEHFYRSDREATTWKLKARRYLPLWALDGLYLLARTRVLKSFAPVVSRPDLGPHEVVFSAIALFAQYFWKLIWPARLSLDYAFPHNVYLLAPWVLAGLIIGAACILLFVLLWRRARAVSFGLLWIVITLSPVLNARWMPDSAFGERYLYLPSVGFAWIAGWSGVQLWQLSKNSKASRSLLAATGGLILALCVARIWTRNPDWRDNFTLYQQTLAVTPGAYVIRNNLGVLYLNRGDAGDALNQWQQALKYEPGYAYALHNLGALMRSEKRYPAAVAYLSQCIEAAPDYFEAHLDLAKTYVDLGLREKAVPEFEAALQLAPLDLDARNSLGELFLDEGSLDNAEEQFRRSIAIRPGLRGLWGLGFVLWERKDFPAAENMFKQAERLDPASSRVHFILGLFYGSRNRNADAIREYRQGLAIDPSNSQARTALKKLEQSQAAKP